MQAYYCTVIANYWHVVAHSMVNSLLQMVDVGTYRYLWTNEPLQSFYLFLFLYGYNYSRLSLISLGLLLIMSVGILKNIVLLYTWLVQELYWTVWSWVLLVGITFSRINSFTWSLEASTYHRFLWKLGSFMLFAFTTRLRLRLIDGWCL